MVKWFEKCYMDEVVSKHPKRYQKRVESKRMLKRGCAIIVLASNEENLFDIIDISELFFGYYKRKELYVVGIARDKESATKLLETLLLDMIEEEGTFSPRKFFSKEKFC